ncbi:uncharacterized protein [Neodiprion pinetum]|uniref:uncharacterized protein n=1 Tax=Neodiprion pinetum TaxID=441929 RepID=UPI001EDE66CB|nr:uncharacterized protein LOC124222708 isoform X2 [Neodiprion pinetum]
MPKLKQPTPLKKRAFDFIVTHCASYCHQLSVKGDLEKLRQSITEIKSEVFSWLPPILNQLSEFCERFFDEFSKFGKEMAKSGGRVRSMTHRKVAVEIMMDVEIPGLRCSDLHLECANRSEYRRFQSIEVLIMQSPSHAFPSSKAMSYFRLENLIEIWLITRCNNQELRIIGTHCKKLQILNITYSRYVTDDGLRALQMCADLRVIDFVGSVISNDCINELLSTHKKLEEFNIIKHDYLPWAGRVEVYDPCSRARELVCPSIRRYCARGPVSEANLIAITVLFPNLTYIQFCCQFFSDLTVLKNLKHLTELSFLSSYSILSHVRHLLTTVGENISSLEVKMSFRGNEYFKQDDVNFIYKLCPNIQELILPYDPNAPHDILVVPPFNKLKVLSLKNSSSWEATVEFHQLPELETLMLANFTPIVQIVERAMFDNVKFPKLKRFCSMLLTARRDTGLDDLNTVARERNLDFKIVTISDHDL